MLKWAMRIVAVSGALLAMAVGTAAWMHRTQGRMWRVVTPKVWSDLIISPRYVEIHGCMREDAYPVDPLGARRYGVVSSDWDNADTESSFELDLRVSNYGKYWHGFAVARGYNFSEGLGLPSYTEALCPTWAVIAALLLPMGLWAGIGWRQRRRIKAGCCVNCGYDLRATPEKCPECGRAVKGSVGR